MTQWRDHADEFDCAECGEHIVAIGHSHRPLCAKCVHMPGWFKKDEVRAILAPDHDGRDPADRSDDDHS